MNHTSGVTRQRARSGRVQSLPGADPTMQRLPAVIGCSRASLDNFDSATRREWLVTNGIGGFASGTVGGARSRRYHGLLLAALNPPLGRTLMLAKLELSVSYRGHRYELSANEFYDGTISPDGYRYLESFSLQGSHPIWRYAFADVVLEQRIWMQHGRNTVYLQLAVLRAVAPLQIRLAPLLAWRDYHAQNRGATELSALPVDGGFEVRAFEGARPYRVLTDTGRYTPDPAWYWGFRHRVESYRGLDDTEDLYRPGHFELTLSLNERAAITASTEGGEPQSAVSALRIELGRQRALLPNRLDCEPEWIRQLVLAADQFIVQRGAGEGRTVIAGYPWFGDWGRDTMIALPGLTLATGRHDIAKRILLTFAEHVSEGMLPNRFPDHGETPEYNTVDASLWYFHAIDRYLASVDDEATALVLYPVLSDIVAWHQRGTRYAIHVDRDDGLLAAGEPGVQLTWMDAKVGDWVVTPRVGKAVEINALWHNALAVMTRLAARLGDGRAATLYRRQAAAVARQFRERFWNASRGCLYDVIDGPEGELDASGRRRDHSVRPNQLFAVSLPAGLLGREQARGVIDVCARELYTPLGMRSLASDDERYARRYGGNSLERDGAYHQGTVWSWLLGPFVTAHYRVYRNVGLARSFLDGIAGHLQDGCLGQISEIFDADPPHAPRGCPAQAWSVAEVLRAWLELSAVGAYDKNGERKS